MDESSIATAGGATAAGGSTIRLRGSRRRRRRRGRAMTSAGRRAATIIAIVVVVMIHPGPAVRRRVGRRLRTGRFRRRQRAVGRSPRRFRRLHIARCGGRRRFAGAAHTAVQRRVIRRSIIAISARSTTTTHAWRRGTTTTTAESGEGGRAVRILILVPIDVFDVVVGVVEVIVGSVAKETRATSPRVDLLVFLTLGIACK